MEYTKGEWRKWTDAQGICGIGHPTEPYALAMLTDTFVPARGYWYDQNWGREAIGEREANANLIIAAPELYEALRAARQQIGHIILTRADAELVDRIDKALVKADGRTA